MEPNYAPGNMQRALDELALGNLEEAHSGLASALSSNPDSAITLSYLGLVDELQGDHDGAQKHFDAAFALTPNLAINFVNRARSSLHQNKFAEALQDCDTALTHDAYLSDAYETRSQVLAQLGNSAEAEKEYQNAVKLGWHKWVLALVETPAHVKASTTALSTPAPKAISASRSI